MTLPSQPSTKPGYTFKGWKVVPQYDFTTLDASLSGYSSWAKDVNNTCRYCTNGSCVLSAQVCNNTEFKDLNTGDWKVAFNYGTIYGQSRCSVTYSDQLVVSDTIDESNNGIYCWCRITGIIPSNQSTKYAPKHPIWILNRRTAGSDIGLDCKQQECAIGCSIVIYALQSHRRLAFGQSGS